MMDTSTDINADHDDDAEEILGPGIFQKLSFQKARYIGQTYEQALMASVQAVQGKRIMLLEIGGPEESVLVRECEKVFGKGSAVQLSHWNGGDLDTEQGLGYIQRVIQEEHPRLVWFNPDSQAYSPLQRMNQRNPEQTARLQAKRERTDRQYEGISKIFRAAASSGTTCVLGSPEHCELWHQDWYTALVQDLGLYEGVCQGCQVNRRSFQRVLQCSGWGLVSSDGALIQNLSLQCDGRHAMERNPMNSQASDQAYTSEFARRLVRYLQRKESWFEVAREFQSSSHTCLAASSASPESTETPSEGIQDIPRETRKRIFQNLRKIHTATGHCSLQYLKENLKRRGASQDVMRCAELFQCDVCDERRRPNPRSQATLQELVPKWHTLQCDAFSWNHPNGEQKWQFMLGIDEGSRLRVGRLLFQHQTRTPGMQDFVDFFEGHWLPHFGNPQVLRLDPAGCFRSHQLDRYLSDRSIEVQHIPAEAHWQNSLVERSVQMIKEMMSSLVSEQPTMTASEAFYRSVWACNNRDQYHGYSPLQHAFGRAPDELGRLGESKLRDIPILTEHGVSAEFGRDVKAMMIAEQAFLREQAKERLRRAELSGNRPMKNVSPGDLVYVWRRMTPRQDGQRHFKGGRFVGPYRVLATETRQAQEDLRAGHIVWLYRGGQLLKASPQQLRPATAREEAWAELQGTSEIPWTLSSTLQQKPPHEYEDVTQDGDLMPSVMQDGDPEESEPPPRMMRRMRTKQQPPQAKEPRSRSPVARTREGENQGSETREPKSPDTRNEELPRSRSPLIRGRPVRTQQPLSSSDYLEECGVSFPEEESEYWKASDSAVALSLELPGLKTRKGKEWARDLGCYFVKQLRRNAVEVSEKRLTEAEREAFKGAKQKEVKNFVVAKAFQKLPEHLRPSKGQVLKMRWLLTWKVDDDHKDGEPVKRDAVGNPLKPKARAVVLGYMDPEYEHRPTSSPTMARTTRQLFLQHCANHKFTVEKGDIRGAFLQGDNFGPERPMVCEPLPEICEALGVPHGSEMLLTKAAYGLVEAPIQWYLTVARFLESIGGERQFSDPTCWGFFRADRTPIGWVCGHVDDFLFGGDSKDPAWQKIRKLIQERFKWGQWESGKFTQCGVVIEQDSEGFSLSQPDYLEAVSEIHVSKARWQQPESPINGLELQQLRSVLGALSWHASQVAPQWCAPVSLLLSKIHTGVVNDILETNKLLRKAKLGQHQKMRIHGQGHELPLLAAWVDAADGHRPDGGSTKGIVIGWAPRRLLDGALVRISPMFWQSAKIQRTCRSSGAAETHAAVDADDELYAVRFQVFEFQGGQVPLWSCDDAVETIEGVLISDSRNLYDRMQQTVLTLKGAEKRTDIASLCLKESMQSTKLQVRWVNGDSQLANSLTKDNELHQYFEFLRRDGQWRIVYDPELLSGRRRKQLGLSSLQTQVAE